ncbi:hypothetical protein DAERI_030249 [Deinococcus aerius]|uniref:Uncharacterized protein n=1 Tax=Deinococcus aerius TaxID=200253 RepID=A0A2I9CTI4_9DEIO|nr:hypothetical protein [Deinococcus aerius]GBF05083.1 hypothetical protein DAERI_030249 [Deinococcus aerius]
MLSRLTVLLVRTAGWGWPIPVAGGLALLSFRVLRRTGRAFQAHTDGHEPFDFQNRLTAAGVTAQLGAYTPGSRRWYRAFFVADLVFPLVAALFLGLVWARLLSRAGVWPARLLRWHAPLWPLLATGFDYGENVCFLLLSEGRARPDGPAAHLGVACKRLKLTSLGLTALATPALLMAFLWAAYAPRASR